MDIVFNDVTVITVDVDDRILERGRIGIDRGEIVAIEEASAQPLVGGVTIDGPHKIVMPGLINPHVHLGYSVARGRGDDLHFVDWLPVVFGVEDSLSPSEWGMAAELTILEMLKGGTTCFADTNIYQEIDPIIDVVEASGIRAVLGRSITEPDQSRLQDNPWLARSGEKSRASVDAALEDYERHHGTCEGRLQVRLAPRLWPACSSSGYEKVGQAMDALGVGALIHHTETREWSEFVRSEYGKSPTEMLEDFGVLGPTSLLENATELDGEEIEIMALTDTRFNYLPTANMKIALGALDIRTLLAAGVTVSIGTSGGLINNVNDMFREMKALALQQRMLNGLPDAISATDVLRMATMGGARCLGLDDRVGSIEVGKRADLIVVDTYSAHLQPVFDPVSSIVYCATGADVESVIIDGQIVMKEHEVVTLEESSILAAMTLWAST